MKGTLSALHGLDRGMSRLLEGDASALRPEHILCVGDPEILLRPCVDCGLVTGRFCDGPEGETGPQCFASVRVPSERWAQNQRTPLCSKCDWARGKCHFCRGVQMCTPPAHR